MVITDRGALGYGGIFVYQWSALNGYSLLWKDAPAVASREDYAIEWINENEIDLHYTNANKGDMGRRLTLN